MNRTLTGSSVMNRHRSIPLVAVLLATVALGACGGSSGSLGSVPATSASPDPAVALGSPDATPAPSDGTSAEPSGAPSASTDPGSSSTPTPTPSGTTIVRAYFWLGGLSGSEGLVAVLREIPGTKSVAKAAVNGLLAGPTSGETARSITTSIPKC